MSHPVNDNLEEQATAIFKSWFLDFDLFDTNDQGYPTGWNFVTLGDKVKTSTQSINPQKIRSNTVWHYSIPAFDEEKLPKFDDPRSILSNKYEVPQNAILVSKLNPDTKRIWRTMSCFENAICSTEFIIFNAKNASHKWFFYLLFNTRTFIEFLMSNATGSTNSRMRVKPTSSLDYKFLYPKDESIIDSFCKKVDPLFRAIDENLLEIRHLNDFMPSLIAQTMSSSR